MNSLEINQKIKDLERQKREVGKVKKSTAPDVDRGRPPPITLKKLKKSIANPGVPRRKTKYSFGNTSDKSTNSNKISIKSKSSNKSRLSGKSKGSNKSNVSKDKGKGRKSINQSKDEEQKPKRNFNFGQNGEKRLSEDSSGKKTKKRRSSDGSRRSKTSKGSGKKGSIGSNKGDRDGSHPHKKEHDGHIVPTSEEKNHLQNEESKHVHFQLRYNEWTYFDHIPDSSRVTDLKFRIYMYTRIQPYKQKLYLVRKKLKDAKFIDEYGLISDWYDNDRPALLILKYRDNCVEKLGKDGLDISPVPSPDDFPETLEVPELIAPPSTALDDTVKSIPAVISKKSKKDPGKPLGKGAKESVKIEGPQSEFKVKPKGTMTSVQSKDEKGKEKGETNVITSKSQLSASDRDSGSKKQSNTNASKKKTKSIYSEVKPIKS